MYPAAPAISNAGLVHRLKNEGIFKLKQTESTLLQVDRGDFARTAPYSDSAQSIGYGATISAPHMHAQAVELLNTVIKEDSTILDIGCGSGYLTACFAKMIGPKGKVVGIDHISELVDLSEKNIRKHNANLLDSGTITLITGDGRLGYPEMGPYDAIHVGAAAATLPKELIDQLAIGGRMLIPVGTSCQSFYQIDKDAEGQIHSKNLYGVIYVPLTSREHQLGPFYRY